MNPSPVQSTLHTSVISLIYRDYTSPFRMSMIHLPSSRRVLDKNRRPLGYVDVASLKAKWEAGIASPVRLLDQTFILYRI